MPHSASLENEGATMKAMVIDKPGPPECFREADIELAELAAGHVRVKVLATSVNPIDCKIRELGLPFGPAYPAVLHGDVSGVVTEVAADVTRFKVGDRIFGCAGGVKATSGALAEFMDCDANLIALAPKSCSAAQAAALPLAAITAWEALVDKANIGAGMSLLVHGGTGGVGHIAVQIGVSFAAKVAASVSSAAKAEIVAGLGATPVLYRSQDVDDYVNDIAEGCGFDVVFDTVGGENIAKSWQAAKIGGHVISCQSNSTQDLGLLRQKALTHSAVLMLLPLLAGKKRDHHGNILQRVAALVDAGKLAPILDKTTFSLDQIGDAHRRLQSGQAIGKVVVNVAKNEGN